MCEYLLGKKTAHIQKREQGMVFVRNLDHGLIKRPFDNQTALNQVVYLCINFTACIAFLLYLDDVMRAFRKKRGLVIWDWYVGKRMESSSVCEKDTKR